MLTFTRSAVLFMAIGGATAFAPSALTRLNVAQRFNKGAISTLVRTPAAARSVALFGLGENKPASKVISVLQAGLRMLMRYSWIC